MRSEIQKPNHLKSGQVAVIFSRTIWNRDKNVWILNGLVFKLLYWLNDWNTLVSKDTSGFTSNTLLTRNSIFVRPILTVTTVWNTGEIGDKLSVLFINLYQCTKIFQCDTSTFIYYTNFLTNNIFYLFCFGNFYYSQKDL